MRLLSLSHLCLFCLFDFKHLCGFRLFRVYGLECVGYFVGIAKFNPFIPWLLEKKGLELRIWGPALGGRMPRNLEV